MSTKSRPGQGASVNLGLPTSISGSTATGDGTRIPSYSVGYDAYGDVTSYNPGNGHGWTIGYDSSNRVESINDPNSDTSIVCYYGDNTVKYTETPHQNTLDGSPNACLSTIPTYAVSYKRDPDGNPVTETHHHGGVYNSNPLPTKANVTTRYYDGLDRLVEVALPQDPSDVLSAPWITRYIYDLTQGGSLGADYFAKPSGAIPSGFAYGNLFKIQEYLPGASSGTTPTNPLVYAAPASSPAPGQPFVVPNQIGGAAGFADVKAEAYDGADRPTAIYSRVTANGTPNTLATETLHYDNNGYSPSGGGLTATYAGLLDHACNANNQCEYFAYDSRDLLTNVHDTDTTNVASRVLAYDLDGRVSGTAGGDTYTASTGYSYTYTPDSLIATEQEPSGLSEAALFTHNYYSDGLEKSLNVASGALTQVGLFQYSYDGAGSIDSYVANFTNVASAANAGTATVTYGYNNSEMQNSVSVNTPASSGTKTFTTSMTYSDALVSSITYPSATYPTSATNVINNMQYNAEGELLGYNGGGTNRATYSSRGELEQGNAFANGLELPGNTQTKWDPLMSAPVKEGTGPACPTSLTATPAPTSCWTYDNTGRMTQETLPAGINMGSTITLARTYDAENRLVSTSSQNAYPSTLGTIQTQTPAPLDNVQNWGPMDEPNRLGGVNPEYPGPVKQDTLHWSSDGLIFTTKPSGLIDDLKLGTLGDVMPLDPSKPGVSNGATYYERGPDSSIGGCYNANQTEGFTTYPAFGQSTFGQFVSQNIEPVQPCQLNAPAAMPTNIVGSAFIGSFASYPTIGNKNGVVGMFRTDGISNGTDIIQGVRTYDPNSGTWTTPDSFGGLPGDPMSQKSYAWNNNNPTAFNDPTGYFACGTSTTVYQSDGTPITVDGPPCPDPVFIPTLPMSPTEPMGGRGPLCKLGGPLLPPGKTYSAEYAAGLINGSNYVAFYNLTVPFNAPFNYQHQPPGYADYRDGGNFGLGVYARAAGIPMSQIDGAITLVGRLMHQNTQNANREDQLMAYNGSRWAMMNCGP